MERPRGRLSGNRIRQTSQSGATMSKTTTILVWFVAAAAILFGVWSSYNVGHIYLELNTVRADLALAQKKIKQFDDKLSADESDIKDVCTKSRNLSNILSKPENVAARESLGADFLTDQAIVKNVACRVEGKMQ